MQPRMQLGVSLEFARSGGLAPDTALAAAARAGYRNVEPYLFSHARQRVNSHVSVSTELAYTHYAVGEDDPAAVRESAARHGVRFSAMSVHAPLLSPLLGVPSVENAIAFAAAAGAPIVNTDEGPLPPWMCIEDALRVLTITLRPILAAAERHGVIVGLEPHNALTTDVEMLHRLLRHFAGAPLAINFDTGNVFLAGHDPATMIRALAGHILHVHAKDIPQTQVAERGTVTSTRVGGAVGAGVLDFPGILDALGAGGFTGVLCVECDTEEQAQESHAYLSRLLARPVQEESTTAVG